MPAAGCSDVRCRASELAALLVTDYSAPCPLIVTDSYVAERALCQLAFIRCDNDWDGDGALSGSWPPVTAKSLGFTRASGRVADHLAAGLRFWSAATAPVATATSSSRCSSYACELGRVRRRHEAAIHAAALCDGVRSTCASSIAILPIGLMLHAELVVDESDHAV
jgi:hypothetical protein